MSRPKGGVVALTRALAVDHAADGIRVNCVCPGATLTPLLQESIDSALDPEARRRLLDGTMLMRRVGRPEEIANVIRFLASSEASFMTGAIVPVDGGATAA
ncbi:MAG: SDR family oxidoreductase [Proteobacteria bacterium]|nr:SDR family oxidoreductase [Pseudomonadota bacterium]MDA1072184.1 SDR family oxidoreductase [Pseudomonadota bacterium]